MMRIGTSFDFHPFKENRDFILGGVKIPYELGLDGISDADCLYHSIAESILGALALGDLGTYFKAKESKDMDSKLIVEKCVNMMKEKNYHVVNIDSMILLENPKLKDYILMMRENISKLLEIPLDCVSVKATTMERCGIIGKGEGCATNTVVLIEENYE